ncbi:MAG: type II toxin-antitoxin system HipA family toxin [Gammaproteobacteria bacterium]|nr:type II toxin-antitoxin system HipA family toxin [Gammaproteobacteria bacterium]
MAGVLQVWWGEELVGRLTQGRGGDLGFAYDADWVRRPEARALSVSLPKREQRYRCRACRPFFAGLLPDEGQREAVARVLGVSPGNDFALLERLGGEVAGALELLPPGESPESPTVRPQPEPLDDDELVRLLATLPTKPLLAGETNLRLSLAGAQSKLPVVLAGGAVALPAKGQPTTHILKPPPERFPGATENEAFSMRLAASVGLDVAGVEPRSVSGRTFLLIERYDRSRTPEGDVRRVHQEDFCQALGVYPERKYASEGGPGFRDCFALLRRVSARPAVDVLKLLDAAIVNLVIGNADAHGKNYALLYDAAGPRLAPLYDLLSTVAWPELSPRLAMRIGRRATLAEMNPRAWSAFAAGGGLGMPLVRRRVAELTERVRAEASGTAQAVMSPGLDGGVLEALARAVVGRAEVCASTV